MLLCPSFYPREFRDDVVQIVCHGPNTGHGDDHDKYRILLRQRDRPLIGTVRLTVDPILVSVSSRSG